jgi:hypothetical protein
MELQIPPKDCKTYEEVKEYLQEYGVYIAKKDDSLEFILYLLNLGLHVFLCGYNKFGKVYYLIDPTYSTMDKLKSIFYKFKISERPNKITKFVKNGFMKYVKILWYYGK